MAGHKFDCELGYFIREFEGLTNVIQLFAFECRRRHGISKDRFFKDKSAKMTADDLVKELVPIHEKAVPEDKDGRAMLERAISFFDQIRNKRNDVMHSLYMLDDQTVFAIKVKSAKIDKPADKDGPDEFSRTRQVLELSVGSLDRLILLTSLLAQDFGRATGGLREPRPIKKAFIHSSGNDFKVPEIGLPIS